MDRDPLDEPASATNGRCGTCDGARWVRVTAAYAERIVPTPDLEKLAGLTDEELTAIEAYVAERRAALSDSWYPCRECNRSRFFRWAGGHLASDHDRRACAECRDEEPSRRRVSAARERKDLS